MATRCAALLALLVLGQQKEPPPLPGWHADVPIGIAEAKKTGKPLMVVFR